MQTSHHRPRIDHTRTAQTESAPRDCCESAHVFFPDSDLERTKALSVKARFYRRLADTLRWLGPTLALVALPKCPMCLIAYITLITGAGVSMAVAETLRLAVI